MAAITALAVTLTLAGFLVFGLGFAPPPEVRSYKRTSGTSVFVQQLAASVDRRTRILVAGATLAGIGLWLLSGWIVYLVALPLAAIGIPLLLGKGSVPAQLARLDALESWARNLAGLTSTGAGMELTISTSLATAPEAIRPQVATLVARLGARWRTEDALRAFAQELKDPTADLLVSHLLLAEKKRGPGLTRALEDLATSISDEVRARREIETDRAKPQQNVRIITLMTTGLIVLLPVFGQFMAPYSSPIGQLLLAVWLIVYALVLVWMKRIVTTPPTPRLLGHQE
ncbi:type II secretion system F family protein [Pseudoclavibacter sp. AY1H1]|uniref:type II secretion system F family protein n=1 Tax=Pseudoclavibacter sp. AY1H1 TaxID=2080584 RepID=UPI000CE763AC|nr:type II secretion system F family protein [Pseudoclavibacter sp. AY1H1]PPF32638.1 hypothetical protein C5E05_19225 [Pseudoclavibacter sp. AY1H1]